MIVECEGLVREQGVAEAVHGIAVDFVDVSAAAANRVVMVLVGAVDVAGLAAGAGASRDGAEFLEQFERAVHGRQGELGVRALEKAVDRAGGEVAALGFEQVCYRFARRGRVQGPHARSFRFGVEEDCVRPCPGPPGRFEALSVFRRPFATIPEFLLGLARRYGPVTRLRGPFRDVYLFDDPALLEEVLAGKGRSFQKSRGTKRLRPLLGDGLLTSEEPEHLRNRRLVQPAFNRSRVEAYAPRMVAAAQGLSATLSDGQTIDLDRAMMRLTLEIVAETMFGSDVSDETLAIGAALDQALWAYPDMVRLFGEVNDVFPTRTGRRFRRARAGLRGMVEQLIARRRGAGDRGDFVSLLIAARDERGAFSDAQARDEALTILLAGHETTANALTWTFDLLGRHPDAARRVDEELASALGGAAPGLDDLARLPLLRGAISEALRLFPPAWLTGRSALETVRIGACELHRGDVALLSPYVTHRNPRLWSEPERFKPERWVDGPRPERFAFFPFGGGTRTCIGESFAWLEATLVLATLLQRLRFELVDPEPVPLAPLVTLRPARPIRVRVALRRPEPIAS